MADEIQNIVLPVVRIRNMDIWETATFENQKTDKYQLLAMFDKTRLGEFEMLKAAVAAVRNEHFSDNPKDVVLPLGDGDVKVEKWGDMMEGQMYLRTSTYQQPHVFDAHGNVIVNPKDLYPGCHVQLIVRTRVLKKYGKRQILLVLLAIKKIKDDEPFGSTYKMEQALADFGIEAPKASDAPKDEPGGLGWDL